MKPNSKYKKFTPVYFSSLSQDIGSEIWNDQVLLHDDGLLGYGGTRTFGVGGQGGGKTTLNTKVASMSYYVDNIGKRDFNEQIAELETIDEKAQLFSKHVHPETILWRGREFDSWNVLIPEVFEKVYPGKYCKPLRVHIYKDSTIQFNHQNSETKELEPIAGLDIKRYSNVAELYAHQKDGGVNVVYPPIEHYMSQRLKNSINTKRNVSKTDKKYLAADVDYLVERDVFLFEIFEYLYRANLRSGERKWFTVIIDESHDLFRSQAPDIYYWIIECMVDVLVDTRKHNLSLACMTHALNLIDYRILGRASHFIWVRGGVPVKPYSNVPASVVQSLASGQGCIESCMDGKMGGFTFNRIPSEVSRLVVTGIVEDKELIDELSRDEMAEIGGSYDGEEVPDTYTPPRPAHRPKGSRDSYQRPSKRRDAMKDIIML